MKKVWCLGLSMLDIVTQPIIKWPEYGGAVNSDTTELLMGGMALNSAVAIAKLGKVPVGLISCLGNDVGGQVLKNGLTELHIDFDHICTIDSLNTGNAICFVHPGGERSFVLCMAANHLLNETNIDFAAFHEGDYLHIGGAMIMNGTRGEDLARILKKAKLHRVTISVDTCWDGTNQWNKILDPCLPYCDIFLTNDEEAKKYSGKNTIDQAIDYFKSFGPQMIIIKMGSNGVLIQSNEFSGHIPIFPVDMIDATGAGDSFDAGFLFGLFNHWPVEQSGIFASAVGAKCVTAYGATTGVESYEETVKMIRARSRAGNWNWAL